MGFYMVNLANFVDISYKKDKILSVIPPATRHGRVLTTEYGIEEHYLFLIELRV